MHVLRWGLGGILVVLLGLLPALGQQQGPGYPTPRLATVFPMGGQAGAEVEITVEGTDLDEVSTLYFSQPGIKAERLRDLPPVDKKDKNKQAAPPARFKVTIPKGTPAGIHDLRVIGKWGISNPRAFVVGDRPETVETEPNNDVPQAQAVALNTTVYGRIDPKLDVDYFAFAGKKDQHVVVHCASGSADSRLTPLLQLYDASGKLLASNREYRQRDAVIDYRLPADGDYQVRVCEFTYISGGPEYFYRLSITDTPWIDAAYPPVVEKGKETEVTLFGRHLPGGLTDPNALMGGRPLERLKVRVPPADTAATFPGMLLPCSGSIAGMEYRTRNGSGLSNPVFLSTCTGPVVLDNESNETPQTAQAIVLPCELCGRIEKNRDRDWYSFTAKKDDVFVFEGYADRLRAPLDLYFRIHRSDTHDMIGEFDDHPDVPNVVGRFYTRTDDPKTRFVVPADGAYRLLVSSRGADSLAGPRRVYHLSLRKEQPDYRLVVVGNNDASATRLALRQGGCQEVQVVCFSQDGFAGEVALNVDGLPPGVTCVPQVLGPGLRETSLVLKASADAADWAGPVAIKGTATINGAVVTRTAQAGCLVWPVPQQNAPGLSRLSRSICLAVRGKGPYTLDVPTPEVTALAGSSVTVKVKVNRQAPEFKAPVQLTRLAAPALANGQLIAVPNVNIAGAEGEVKLTIPATTPPGTYNLVFRGTAPFPLARDAADKKKANVQVVEVTPAIKLTVFNVVAEIALEKPTVTVQPGADMPVLVKLKRLHGYKGEFKVQLVLPQNLKDVSAADVTVAPGADDAKLVLKAAANAKAGPAVQAVVRVTAMVDKTAVTQEARLGISLSGKDATGLKVTPLLPASAEGWKYQEASTVQGDAWRSLDFNADKWTTGKAPLGYGEDEIAKRKGSEIKANGPVYFRRSFEVPAELLSQKNLAFRLAVASDDSAVVYVNGILADQDPEEDHEFSYWNREIQVPVKVLRPGKNVVAVMVKNKSGSSDLFFDLEIQVLGSEKSAK